MTNQEMRAELLTEKIGQLELAAIELALLMDKTDLTEIDPMSARAAIQRAQDDVKKALKPLDRELSNTHMGEHERVGDYVIMVSRKKDSETYRGGDSKTLRHEVVKRVVADLCGSEDETIDDESLEAETQFSRNVADALARVWTQPPKSKLASKAALKKLGLDPGDWFEVEIGSGVKVDVLDVDLYESRIGPAPKETRFETKVGEPF